MSKDVEQLAMELMEEFGDKFILSSMKFYVWKALAAYVIREMEIAVLEARIEERERMK